MIEHVITDLRAEEGFVSHVYKDHRGVDSIGWGFNIDAHHGGNLPITVADFWMRFLVDRIAAGISQRWPLFEMQDENVQRALVLMAYQMGLDGLFGFHLMIGALERGDRETAAENALDSEWHRDEKTAARAERVASLIRGHV